MYQEAPRDSLLLVVIGTGLGIAYQGSMRILNRRWVVHAVLGTIIAVILGIVMVLTLGR